ncbi:MAG: hypothetical protein ACK40G_18190 [Cytophagaceae bacterium]
MGNNVIILILSLLYLFCGCAINAVKVKDSLNEGRCIGDTCTYSTADSITLFISALEIAYRNKDFIDPNEKIFYRDTVIVDALYPKKFEAFNLVNIKGYLILNFNKRELINYYKKSKVTDRRYFEIAIKELNCNTSQVLVMNRRFYRKGDLALLIDLQKEGKGWGLVNVKKIEFW